MEKGEDWSRRKYILGGYLQRRLEKRKAIDEEDQSKERQRPTSNMGVSRASGSTPLATIDDSHYSEPVRS
ncbi:hypothetical protein NPX13_g9226 [Xylaria arbuscula]|uniref:Uncharacterized protein n=1 Tax=Xylaria arbuscula TaxID=114810 RepID=A0A9W8TJD0_9PEZI|nr:hypothetical protein NPX13_g9226 [Xylaria arbuscula]